MNLIASIAEGLARGLTSAKISIELELKHGVQVSEAWIEKIMSSDAFSHAQAAAVAALETVEHAPAEVVQAIESIPADVKSGLDAGVAEATAPGASAESSIVDAPAPVAAAPVPAAPETKAAPDAVGEGKTE